MVGALLLKQFYAVVISEVVATGSAEAGPEGSGTELPGAVTGATAAQPEVLVSN